jgi:S1-C subfamily serine protease
MATERSGPGDEAGIQPGDVIVSFEEEEVSTPSQLVLLLTRAEVGATVPIEIRRAGKRLPLTVTVGRRPR